MSRYSPKLEEGSSVPHNNRPLAAILIWAVLCLSLCRCGEQPAPPVEEISAYEILLYNVSTNDTIARSGILKGVVDTSISASSNGIYLRINEISGPNNIPYFHFSKTKIRPDFFHRPPKVSQAYEPPRFAYYRVWIEQDGERWAFTVQTPDTSLFLDILQADSLRLGVEACNFAGQSGGIVWSDVYRIQPDTLQYPLEATTGTNYNWVTIPSNMQPLPARASDLASLIHLQTIPPTPCWTIAEWNATAQSYNKYLGIISTDFPIYSGRAYRIEMAGSCVWKPTVRRATREGWCWQPSEDDQ